MFRTNILTYCTVAVSVRCRQKNIGESCEHSVILSVFLYLHYGFKISCICRKTVCAENVWTQSQYENCRPVRRPAQTNAAQSTVSLSASVSFHLFFSGRHTFFISHCVIADTLRFSCFFTTSIISNRYNKQIEHEHLFCSAPHSNSFHNIVIIYEWHREHTGWQDMNKLCVGQGQRLCHRTYPPSGWLRWLTLLYEKKSCLRPWR